MARQYENYYEYDPAGNRTLLRHGETDAENLTYYDYDAANELTALHDVDGWTYFGYDGNGNTVMEQTPAHTRYYDWDGRDMMVGVRSTEQGWTDNVYRYDGMPSRVSTLESAGFSYYDWDGINVVQEKTGAGTVTDRQVHGYAPTFSVGDIALMDKSGTPYVPVSDQVGTVWNLLDGNAAKANSYTYDAFGVGRSTSETISNRYRFGTKRLDTDPTHYHFAGRCYSPEMGRFLNRDPVERFIGLYPWEGPELALYPYASARPTRAVDPTGLASKDVGCCGRRIGNALAVLEDLVERTFEGADRATKIKACKGLHDILHRDPNRGNKPIAANAWDICEFWDLDYLQGKQGMHCATGDCANTVWLRLGCYSVEGMNYMMWGWVNRLCFAFCPKSGGGCDQDDYSEARMRWYLEWYLTWRHPFAYGYQAKARAWALFGYQSADFPEPDRTDCPDCGRDLDAMKAYWYPFGWMPAGKCGGE